MARRSTLFAAVIVAALAVAAPARPAAPSAEELLRSLPAGDAVATVDVATLLSKTLPTVLASRPASKEKLDTNIARIESSFGVDVRQIRAAALSASMAGGQTNWVAALDGKFDGLTSPEALSRAAEQFVKSYPQYTATTETYEGATIHVFPRTGGAARDTIAVAVLDATTALYGSPEGVRAAIGVRKGKGAAAASQTPLVEAWRQADPGAVIRFATILPRELVADAGGDPFAKSLAAIRSVFGSAGVGSDNGLALKTTARTGSAEDAKSVHATLTALVGLGRQLAANRPELAALVDYVSVSTAGVDVQMNVAIPPEKLDPVFRAVARN